MKKLLSIMLALILVFSMATVAFAEGGEETPEWNGTYTATDSKDFEEIEKTYTSKNNVVVKETLSFTSTPVNTNPDYATNDDGTVADSVANLSVEDLEVSSLTPGKLKVTIPSLSKAGTYEWIIKETAGNTAGVSYSEEEVHVIVLVVNDNTDHSLKISNTTSYIKKINGEKSKTFTNTFKSGSFTVKKDVIGNLADESVTFDITVTLTSTNPIRTDVSLAGATVEPNNWTTNYEADGTTVKNYTYTKKLTISESSLEQTFKDIPTDVTVTVKEDETNLKGYDYVGTYEGTYTVEDTEVTGTKFEGLTIKADANTDITVVNSNSTSIETGITLDSVPYFLMLSIACVGMFLLLSKKRANREY